MTAPHANTEPIWNQALPLPLVTDDSELFEFQILLGGISLVLSRLHPSQGKNRFTYTRGLAMKLTRLLEHSASDELGLDDAGLRKLRPSSLLLTESLAECERTLDTGTLIVFRRMQIEALRDEQANAARAQNDSRFGSSVSGALVPGDKVQAV
jgi:hypothetical protein